MGSSGDHSLGSGASSGSEYLHDYRLLRRVGAGSYGDVWLAEDAVGKHVAVKVIDRERLALISRTNREERGLSLIRTQLPEHDHLIRVHHVRHRPITKANPLTRPGGRQRAGPGTAANEDSQLLTTRWCENPISHQCFFCAHPRPSLAAIGAWADVSATPSARIRLPRALPRSGALDGLSVLKVGNVRWGQLPTQSMSRTQAIGPQCAIPAARGLIRGSRSRDSHT